MTTLENFMPHRAPMLLISRVISASAQFCEVEVDVKVTDIFCENGGVPSWVGVEYLAQTIALHGGHTALVGSPTQMGFLLGVRKYRTAVARFEVGNTLRVCVEPIMVDQGVGTYRGTISMNGEKVADATLTIFKPDERQ